MKKNGVKKLGALVLSGILAVSLVGCGAARAMIRKYLSV